MRVKKFEAESMQSALRLVKDELGPDAIILSAREFKRGQGKTRETGIEVTAAISESTLKRKHYTESKLSTAAAEKYRNAPAKAQKQLINQMVDERVRQLGASQPVPDIQPSHRLSSTLSYIDIPDDPTPQRRQESAVSRIRNATREAFETFAKVDVENRKPVAAEPLPLNGPSPEEVHNLKAEIERLQKMISDFKGQPPNIVYGHPGAQFGLSYDFSFLFQRLLDVGVDAEIAASVLAKASREIEVSQQKKRPLIDAWLAKYLLSHIRVSENPVAGRLHLFVGPTGSGKTSALVKFASHLVVKQRKRVAVVSCDTFRVGAVDQMKIYAQILNIPFAVLRNRSDWEWIWSQSQALDYVLVDYPGWLLKDQAEYDLFNQLRPPAQMNPTTHLVLSAMSKDSDASDVTQRYSTVGFNDFIFTGLDLSVQNGMIWNMHDRFERPLHSFSIGSRIPEDFEFASKERVLDVIFKLSKINQAKA